MTLEAKCFIMKQRYENVPVKDIADELGLTPQGVYRFLSTIPYDREEFVKKPGIPECKVNEILFLYFRKRTLQEISEETGIPKEEIKDLFAFCLQSKRKATVYPLYPSITKWLNSNGYTLARLAQEIGESAGTLQTAFSGDSNIKYDLGRKICDFTGLTMRELYSELLTKDQKEALA